MEFLKKKQLALLALGTLLVGCGDSGDVESPPPDMSTVTGLKTSSDGTPKTANRPQPIGAGQGVGFGPDMGHAKGDRYMPPSAKGGDSGKPLDTELPK